MDLVGSQQNDLRYELVPVELTDTGEVRLIVRRRVGRELSMQIGGIDCRRPTRQGEKVMVFPNGSGEFSAAPLRLSGGCLRVAVVITSEVTVHDPQGVINCADVDPSTNYWHIPVIR